MCHQAANQSAFKVQNRQTATKTTTSPSYDSVPPGPSNNSIVSSEYLALIMLLIFQNSPNITRRFAGHDVTENFECITLSIYAIIYMVLFGKIFWLHGNVNETLETTNMSQNQPNSQLFFYDEDGQVLSHQNDGTKENISPNLTKANDEANKVSSKRVILQDFSDALKTQSARPSLS